MKYTGQISTGQYEFMAFELESDDPSEAVASYQSLKTAFQGGVGLPDKEWRQVVDSYFSTGKVDNGADLWERMSDLQRAVCQEFKKYLNRTNKEN